MSYELEPALARRFVRIFEEAGETWKGAGTGFWLAPDLVLTAWHVVEKAHKARRALGVLPDGRAEDPLPARVLWPETPPGENGLDAALLRLEEGADRLLSHPRLRSTLLGPGQEWRSKGWPVAVPEEYDWADLRGKTGALQGDRETLEVYVEGAPKTGEEWQGISGAAAFVAGEWVGVVKESAESWDGERLYLVTSAALLAAPGFREALALPEGAAAERAQRREKLLVQIERLLRHSNGAAASLLANLPEPEGSAAWQQAFSKEKDGVGALCRLLTRESRLDQVLLALDKAHESLLGVELYSLEAVALPALEVATARTLEELASLLIPILQQAVSVQVEEVDGSSIIGLEVFSPTIAEFLLSGRDQLPARFRPPDSEDDHPPAEGALPPPVVRGIDLLGRGTFARLVADAVEALLPAIDKAYIQNQKIAQTTRLENLIARLNGFFQRQATHPTHPRHYYVLLEPHEEADQDFAEQVKAHLPLLKIVRRTGQDFAAESDLCAPLVRLLWRARQWKEAHAGVS